MPSQAQSPFASHLQQVLAYLKQGHPVLPAQPMQVPEPALMQAHNYMRGMNTLANGGSFGGFKSAGQYGAENTQNLADSIRRQGPYLPQAGP